jgi:hypothetical protein
MFKNLLSSGSDTDEKLVVIVTLLSLVLDRSTSGIGLRSCFRGFDIRR